VDMRIVDDEGRELPWDGKAFGNLQVKGCHSKPRNRCLNACSHGGALFLKCKLPLPGQVLVYSNPAGIGRGHRGDAEMRISIWGVDGALWCQAALSVLRWCGRMRVVLLLFKWQPCWLETVALPRIYCKTLARLVSACVTSSVVRACWCQVRGPHVISRYFNSDAQGADADGWFDTGACMLPLGRHS
jgi:hypothetical protein